MMALLKGGGVVKMKLSKAGLSAIAAREGFSATRYKDSDGESIGFGHFILLGDSFSEPISKIEGLALLEADAAIAERAVRAFVVVPLSQDQFDALVSFVYNVGANAFKNSTLLRKLNAGDVAGAVAQFAVWNKDRLNGQVITLAELTKRRASEAAQFVA